MRYALIAISILIAPITSANAQIGISAGIGIPGVNISINLPLYPQLVQVPGYPVYYAPELNSNYFFYDGMYWAYESDEWYASSWYNGPWGPVNRDFVPLYVLRVPVRYYRNPPQYFHGWRREEPPRWGQHWGNDWGQRRRGWDQWDPRSVPRIAPLPVYQRQYSGDRYPRVEQQHELHTQNYRHQPRDAVVQQRYREQAAQRPAETTQRREQGSSQEKATGRQDSQRSNQAPAPRRDAAPVQRPQPPQRGIEDAPKAAPAPAAQKGAADKDQSRQPQQRPDQREQQMHKEVKDKGSSSRRQEQDKDRDKGEGKSQERGPDRSR